MSCKQQHRQWRPRQQGLTDGVQTKTHPEPAHVATQEQCHCQCSCGKRDAAPRLFVDEEFPARWNVLHNPGVAAAWLRPHEIRKEPRLFVEGCSRFAVQQGCLGDSWFIAACAAVADRPELLEKLVPKDQVLYGPGYDGSVTFRLWHLGEWQEVRIDDRIPVDAHGIPVYARCQHKDEFWLPLLEKAFAKFHRNYCFIHQQHSGSLSEGLINLTGYSITSEAICKWDLSFNFENLKQMSDLDAMMLCRTDEPGPGLPGCHSYTITKVFHKPLDKHSKEGEEELRMVRVRNPWGTNVEWVGAWKDGDERWNKLSGEVKEAMEFKAENDGEFWMDIKDFCDNFSEVCFATEKPVDAMKMEVVAQIIGHWSDDPESGGIPDDIERFAKNPQFLLVALGVKDPDEEEENRKKQKVKKQESKKVNDKGNEGDEKEEEEEAPINPLAGMEAVVELVQEHNRKKRTYNYRVSYYIFESCTERRLSAEEMLQITYVTGATYVSEDNGVRSQVRLFPGRRYVIVPTTETAGQDGDFLLRVFSRHARVRLTELSS